MAGTIVSLLTHPLAPFIVAALLGGWTLFVWLFQFKKRDFQFNAWRTQELSLDAFAARSVIEIQPLLRHA